MVIKSRAPLRISFAGGGTDVSPFPEKYNGTVVNATINKYTDIGLKLRKDKKLTIKLNGLKKIVYPNIKKISHDDKFDQVLAVIKHFYQKPEGLDIQIRMGISSPGLGSSSSLFVSLIGGFNELLKLKLNKYKIAQLAFNLERKKLKNLGGRQDQYASTFGGINWMEFRGATKVKVIPLRLFSKTIRQLENALILLDIGKRISPDKLMKDQIKNIKTNKETIRAMLATKKITFEVKKALLSSDLNKLGQLLDQAWQLKKKFTPLISNQRIDSLYEKFKKVGALGGKIAGSGGGGHMLILCQPNKKNAIKKEAKKFKIKPQEFKFDFSGLSVKKISC